MKQFSLFLILLFILSLFSSCNEDNRIEADIKSPPVIELDSETGIYAVKVGHPLTIAPTVQYADDALFSWTIDNKLVGTSASYTSSWDEPGEVYITFRVQTDAGKAEELLKVEVAELGVPVISLAIPASGLKVLAATDYILTPDIQNSDLEDFTCQWIREGKTVSTEESYTFNETETGMYIVTIEASNIDGTARRDIEVEVVEQLPYVVTFGSLSYFEEYTDRYTFAGRPVYLYPLLEYFRDPLFEWEINGEMTGTTEHMFRFTPSVPGKYTIAVSVTDKLSTTARLTRNVTRSMSKVRAETDVYCVEDSEEQRYQAATGSSSALWNKVYEYTPAPGQFIGELKTGGFTGSETTHADAITYAEKRLKQENWVSLGGFGGYIVVGFDHSIPRTENAYDFAIQANAFEGSSEPGIVWVMQDTNGDGLPNDEWYELKGSETGGSGTIQEYEITYYRPAGKGMNVQWTDSQGKSGHIDYLSAWHQQDFYYPAWVKEDVYTLRGTRLESRNIQDPQTGHWANQTYAWGYADNLGEDSLSGDAVDGSGQRNGFRICNAIHRDGTPADLKYIDFIKVQTGINAKSGWLGELSTEVCLFIDLSLENN